MSKRITTEEAWEAYLEAATPNGSNENGSIDLYDIEEMNEAAHQLWELAGTAEAERDALRDRLANFSLHDLRSIWKEHGGEWHGPKVERWSIPEANILGFIAALQSAEPKEPTDE